MPTTEELEEKHKFLCCPHGWKDWTKCVVCKPQGHDVTRGRKIYSEANANG